MRIVGYERVCTARQGASGLGIEAQRQAIDGFVAQRGATLLARFTEVESGRNPDRPELGKALHLAKVTGATLVIAKLDRLSRNAAFLLTLRDSGVRFAAVDLPEANDLTVGIMALVAQQEREAISRRTKEALSVARSRGVKLGNPNGAAALRRAGKGGAPLRAAIARNADRHARDLAPVVADIRAGGATSLRAIAEELNARGMLTRRGGRWHVSTVTNLLDRLGLAGGAMRQSRLMSLVQAVASIAGGDSSRYRARCGEHRPTPLPKEGCWTGFWCRRRLQGRRGFIHDGGLATTISRASQIGSSRSRKVGTGRSAKPQGIDILRFAVY